MSADEVAILDNFEKIDSTWFEVHFDDDWGGGGSVQNPSMNEGDMMWILDDGGRGISSFTASRSRTSIEINSSCSGFR